MTCGAQAIEWQSQRTAAEVISQREEMISQLELADAELRKSGKQARWFHGCDEAVKALCKEVNGFLFQELLAATKYKDSEAVELFRRGAVRAVLHFILCDGQWAFGGRSVSFICVACLMLHVPGAPMIGELACSGIGEKLGDVARVDVVKSIEELRANRQRNNTALLSELREDIHSETLLELAREDAAAGRMCMPRVAGGAELQEWLLNPRFSAEQEKEDGSTKVRAIDHLSWSPGSAGTADVGPSKSKRARKAESVNGYTVAHEKHRHDTLDVLIAAMRRYRRDVGSVPALIKACGSTPACARRTQFLADAGRCGRSLSQNTRSA